VKFIQNTLGVAQSICYNGSNNPDSCQNGPSIIYAWDFPSANPSASSFKGNTTTTYSVAGTYQATLKITDDIGYCSKTETITIGVSLPRWEEIIPFIFKPIEKIFNLVQNSHINFSFLASLMTNFF